MLSFLLFIQFIFAVHFSFGIFAPETLVCSNRGFLPLSCLEQNQTIISYDELACSDTNGFVAESRLCIAGHACKVVCSDGISFITVPEQRCMLYDSQAWCSVNNLKPGDRLLCCDKAFVVVMSVEHIKNKSFLFCELRVEPYHTLYITQARILVHNSDVFIGMYALGAVAATAPPLTPIVLSVGAIGAGIWFLCHKKRNGKNKDRVHLHSSRNQVSLPPPKKPDDDEFKKKHPHGRYEDAPYHRNHKVGQKNPRPMNGQKALDNSFLIEITSPRRIGVSDKQFVILDRTSQGLYHGHVRTWDELTSGMQNILKDHHIVTVRGKIIL